MDSEYDAFSSTNTQHLIPCDSCGRNFNPEALQRHAPICAKSGAKKRKTFDMSKKRAEGTELQQFNKGSNRFRGGAPKKQEPPPKKNNWRQKHEDFINAIRAAKGVTKAMESGAPLPPPPPPSINPDYIQCPHCERRFNETAAQRHINFCKEQHDRLPNKKQPSAAAQQRAAARTQYKAPRLKPKTSPSGGAGGFSSTGGGAYSYGGGTNRPVGGGTSAGRTAGGPGNNRYSTTPNSRNSDGSSSGRALRTGRTAETYSEARQLSAKQRSGMTTTANTPATNNKSSRYGYGTSTHTGPTPRTQARHTPVGGGYHGNGGDHGYHSGDSDVMKGRMGSGTAKFCHECGTKYPVATAKFCCECGIRRATIT